MAAEPRSRHAQADTETQAQQAPGAGAAGHTEPVGQAAAVLTDRLAEHIRRVVDDAPPLTAEQRARLTVLLAPPLRDRTQTPAVSDRLTA